MSAQISLVNPDFVFLVETWLSSEIPSTILDLPNYNIYRRDQETPGGGLIIAVHNRIQSRQFEIKSVEEILAVNVNINSNQIIRFILAYNHRRTVGSKTHEA